MVSRDTVVEYDPDRDWLVVTERGGASEIVGRGVPAWFGVRVVAAFLQLEAKPDTPRRVVGRCRHGVDYGLYCQPCPSDIAGGDCSEIDDEFPRWCGTHDAPIRYGSDVCEVVA